MNWDLTPLFASEKELIEHIKSTHKKAENFEKKYKGNLNKLSSLFFSNTIEEYEQICEDVGLAATYAFLCFATDTTKGGFYAKYQQQTNNISEKILFFELEFNTLNDEFQKKIIKNTPEYEFYLLSLIKEKKHQLTQSEERVLLKKSPTGASAFARLYDEHFSKMRFELDGKTLNQEQILSNLYSEDRELRKTSCETFSKELEKHIDLLTYIYNMVRTNEKIEVELRGYEDAEHSMHLHNRISKKSVDALINASENSYHLVQKYYKVKKNILGYDTLYDYDRYAPISVQEKPYDYPTCQKIILDAFGSFDEEFRQIAQKAFDEKWIDVMPKDAKRGGAFSHPATPKTHPYVLLNHTNKLRDLFTLAHELGHAIHQYYSAQAGYLGSDTPLTTSETASIFAEMIVFDYIKDSLSKEEKTALYSSKLEDIFATLYRQINFTTFEREVHAHQDELTKEQLAQIWLKQSHKMFGDSIELKSYYWLWYSYIPHFIHSPFYCYAYAYGQLLVLAFYGAFKSGACEDFVDKYKEFLKAGGSNAPKKLIAKFGLDIEDESFWDIGIQQIKNLSNEFFALSEESRC